MITAACISGFTTFAYFEDKGCDPLAEGQINNINQVYMDEYLFICVCVNILASMYKLNNILKYILSIHCSHIYAF